MDVYASPSGSRSRARTHIRRAVRSWPATTIREVLLSPGPPERTDRDGILEPHPAALRQPGTNAVVATGELQLDAAVCSLNRRADSRHHDFSPAAERSRARCVARTVLVFPEHPAHDVESPQQGHVVHAGPAAD